MLITNISHIIGDGMSQTEVLYRLIDTEPNDEVEKKQTYRPGGKREKQKVGWFTSSRIFIGGVITGFTAVFGRPDPPNSLKLKGTNDVSVQKRAAFAEQIDLQKVKDVKNKIEGATLNDILIVLLTLCIRKYFDEHDGKVGKVTASFPIDLRGRNEDKFDQYGSPHNKWGYGFMNFHMKFKDRIDLIWKVKKTLDKVKLSPAPIVQEKLGGILSFILPLKPLNAQALNLANKTTAQLSNVAGPQAAVRIAGYTLDDMAFQLFSPLGLYLGILSYNGVVNCSVNADASLGDPKEIAKHWKPEFDALYEEVMAYDGILQRPRTCF